MSELWDRVQQYADFGWHHTGTPVDEVTRAWFGGQLVSCGAQVQELSYSFDHYEVEHCEVLIDGRLVESIPLFYEGVANIDKIGGPSVHRDHVEITGGGVREDDPLLPAIDRALAARADIALVATTGADGNLIAANRPPQLGSGLPVVLVPGREAEAIRDGQVEVSLRSHRGMGNSAIVIGTFNDDAGPPILIATPLTGWFDCAGERGTGIAVALELAKRMSQMGAVTVVGTTGHEIGHLGAEVAVEAITEAPKAIIHLGASVGAGISRNNKLELAHTRYLLTNLFEDNLAGMHRDAHMMGMTLISDPPDWLGEGRNWRTLGRPLLSYLGTFPQFHTPADLPEVSTSPALLEQAMDGVWATVGKLLSGFA